MDYLQYFKLEADTLEDLNSFKPCYKWITFNTPVLRTGRFEFIVVLNLVINGLPSILYSNISMSYKKSLLQF